MSTPKTLSCAVRRDIEKRFSDGRPFTTFNFIDLAESYGKPHKEVTNILGKLFKKNQLIIVGEQEHAHGGGASKRYSIVPGARLTLKTVSEFHREALDNAIRAKRCADKLQQALDAITQKRLSHA